MKPVMKPIMIVATMLAFLISACGAKAVPTIDPAQVQASAMAAANTMVAMTQAAIPTETLAPPTAAATAMSAGCSAVTKTATSNAASATNGMARATGFFRWQKLATKPRWAASFRE